jgi:hypothetical protein
LKDHGKPSRPRQCARLFHARDLQISKPCGDQNAGTAGEPPLGRRHESRGLLVPRQHEFDLRVAKRFQHIEVFFTRKREDAIDAFVFKCRNQQVGAFGHPSAPCLSIRCARARVRSDHGTAAPATATDDRWHEARQANQQKLSSPLSKNISLHS